MDLNDPRRRLQVLNNASPSIRIATAPQQQISIAQPKPLPQIQIPQSVPQAAPPQAAPNTYKQLSKTNEKNKTIFGKNAAWLLPKGNEKVATYGAGADYQANPQDFLKQFDNLDEAGGIKGAYVADLQKKSATDPVAAQTLKLLQENGRFKGSFDDFASGANDKLYGGMSRGFLRGVDFVLPGHNTFGLEKEADRQEAQPQFTTAGKVGEKFGNVEKGIVDVATLALGSGAAETAASKVPAFTNLVEKLQQGGKISRVTAKMIAALPGSLGGSATDVLETAGRGDEQNVGKSVALGTAVDLGLPFLGTGLKKGFNLFKGGSAEKTAQKSVGFIEDLISETDPNSIKKVLGVDNEMANYLATETNPNTVKQILEDLQVDPNFKLPPDVEKRLQEEGITAVRQDKNDPYGASYKDGVISASSQEELDKNVYHELGHRIWEKDLTPEEKALFTGQGQASKQAVGRPGYNGDNVNSEDFADYMRLANSGRLNEVPEEVRSVVQKYARVAAQDATAAVPTNLPAEDLAAIKAAGGTVPEDPGTVFHLPEAGVHTKLTPEQAAFLKDENKNIPWSATDRPHLTAGDKVREATKEVSQEEFAKLSENARVALANAEKQVPANAPTAQAVEDVSKAQTGTADGQIAGDGKTISEGSGDIQGTTQAQVDEALAKGDHTLLLNSVNPRPGPVTGEGPNPFVVSDKPENIALGKNIKSIDRELEKVRQGNSTKSPAEIRELIAKRESLVAQAQGAPAPVEAPKDARRYKSTERAMEGSTPVQASEIVPEGTDPAIHKSVQDFLDGVNREGGTLDRAEVGYNAAQRARKTETGSRIGKGDALYAEAGGGEDGFRSKLGSLRGKKTESGYTPISIDKEVETHLLDAVQNSKLRPYEKLNTQNALRKVWGANPEKPAAHDINYIRTFLNKNYGEGVGDEFAGGIQKALDAGRDWKDVASEVAGLPRALMATGDLSGGFRQAMPLGTRFPKLWANANKESVKWALNPKAYESAMKEIADSPNYQTVQDLMGVDLTGVGAMQDEAFIGAGMAEKIPGAGIAVRSADRAYTGVLTKLRWDVANKIIDDSGGVDQFMKNVEEMHGDKTKDYMRAWGEVINTFTGRGGKKGGALDQHMKTLSTGLFAPRLWAANVQRLNPIWYARLAKTNPQAAKLAVQSQGTFLMMAGTVLGLASAAGAQVGTDPRSADFGKIKVGNTRYDILGGQQQNIVQLARQFTGEKVNSETGEVATLGDGFGAKTRFDLFTDMLENKSNPLIGFGIKLANTKEGESGNPFVRQDQYGNDFNIGTNVARLGIPLGLQGAYDTSKDVGNPVKGTALNAPSFFGVGVQTYGNIASKDQGKDSTGKLVFKGKVTPEMVTGLDGQVLLDDKGKPISVKYPKDATELEKSAIMDQKRKSALSDAYKKTLPKEDQALMKLSDEQLKKYVSDGKIDQARYDKIQNYQKTADSQGKENDYSVPDGVKSPLATNFYKKYNSMNEKDQKAWLKQPADETAKTITGLLNKERSEGLSEFKPSNEVSKAYAEYEKDLNTHPEYTEIDKRNKAKAFQTYVYKQNYSDNQRDIFAEGGSADLKTLIDEKQVDKKDLDEAIKMDNELYNSGLTGSLKFSKTFRKNFGYGLPDGGGRNVNPGSGGSGGGSNDSVNRHLADFLPSESSAKGSPAPQFSSKRRTTGISFKDVSTPKGSSGKKIRINL